MTDDLRRGPSGPPVALTSDNVANLSNVLGANVTDALDALLTSQSYPGSFSGSILSVPLGGGAPVGLRGTLPGQLLFWKNSTGLWLPTPTAPADGQFAVWNAASEAWEFTDPPTVGDIQYFDNVTIPAVGLWNFNGVLTDSSGNGNNVSVEAGATNFADIVPGKKGLWVAVGNRYGIATPSAALSLLGDMTIQSIIQLNSTPTTGFTVTSYGGSGELSSANFLYSLGVSAAPIPISLGSFWETGAGVDVGFNTASPASLAPIHNVIYVAQVRSAGGTRIQHYVNGKPFGALSGALTAPTDGSLSRFLVGTGTSTGTATESGIIMGIKISSSALTAAQVLGEYNRTLGPGFGILT